MDKFPDRGREGAGIDGGEADQSRDDGIKVHLEVFGGDEGGIAHGADVGEVPGVAALQLRQGLGVEIVVVEIDGAVPRDPRAPSPPARHLGEKLVRGGEFDIEVQVVFEGRDGLERAVRFGVELEVDIYRRCPPAVEDGGRPTDEVDAARTVRSPTEAPHELPDRGRVCLASHGGRIPADRFREKSSGRRVFVPHVLILSPPIFPPGPDPRGGVRFVPFSRGGSGGDEAGGKDHLGGVLEGDAGVDDRSFSTTTTKPEMGFGAVGTKMLVTSAPRSSS